MTFVFFGECPSSTKDGLLFALKHMKSYSSPGTFTGFSFYCKSSVVLHISFTQIIPILFLYYPDFHSCNIIHTTKIWHNIPTIQLCFKASACVRTGYFLPDFFVVSLGKMRQNYLLQKNIITPVTLNMVCTVVYQPMFRYRGKRGLRDAYILSKYIDTNLI